MSRESINLEVLSTRTGFNSAVRHMTTAIEISGTLGANNLGDVLYERADEALSGERCALLLRMLLVDKLGYKTISANLNAIAPNISALAEEFAKWKGVDLIAAYHHPDMGLIIANPKSAEELSNFGLLRRHELLVIYAGKGNNPADESCQKAAELAVTLFEGGKAKAPPELLKGNFTVKQLRKAAEEKPAKAAKVSKAKKDKAAKSSAGPKTAAKTASAAKPQGSVRVAPPAVTAATPPAVSKGPVRMTPMYSVVVSNELFHNGNVEAWKRIIRSYNMTYPDLQVFVYYDGERILDLNTLFKWGKVKHGSVIQFAVAGNNIKDVAKLQRYFAQGASSRYEAFLQGPALTVIKLFG